MIDRAIINDPDKPFDFFNDFKDTEYWLQRCGCVKTLKHLRKRKSENDKKVRESKNDADSSKDSF